jgi:hypothetical protein
VKKNGDHMEKLCQEEAEHVPGNVWEPGIEAWHVRVDHAWNSRRISFMEAQVALTA